MSEDESPTTGGQQENDADFDANNSIIDKVKSRVSSIFPQTLSKWFSPTTSTTTTTIDDNRNGNLRRRRDEQLDKNEKRHQQQQNSDDSESDGGGSGSRSDVDLISMPPSKKSRLNYDDYPTMPPNRNLFASTPMIVGGNNGRRKNTELIKNTVTPYNFISTGGSTTSTFISSSNISVGDARRIDEPHYIDEEGDVLEVVTDRREWTNKKNISSRRSLNIPTTSSFVPSQSPSTTVRHKNSKLYNETGEQTDNINNENDDDDIEDEDDDEIRKAQKQYLTNGLQQQSITHGDISSGSNLNNSGRISRTGGIIGDSASESDESQCSSLIRQQRNIDKPKSGLFYPNLGTTTMTTTNSQIGSKRAASMINGLNFYSHLEGKKSLFSEKNMNSILNNSTLSLTSLNRRQQFNASLYGSTSALSDSRLLNTISPFYKGRTTYGGASAYNKYAQLSQLKQQRQIRVTPTLMRPTSSLSSSSNNSFIQENNNQNINNNNTTTTVISNTAKRILELMDQFTTPLNEVKKMANTIKIPLSSSPANKKRFTEADLIASRGIRLSKPLTPYSRPISLSQQQQIQSGQLPPPISELHVPSMAQLLQLKRLQNNNEKLREIANSSKSILNQREDYKLPNEMNIINNNNNNDKNNSNNINICDNICVAKHINKMKNKINITRQSNKNQHNEEQQITDINLPNVQLPFMKSVPKIDINITTPLPTASAITISPQHYSNSLNSKKIGVFSGTEKNIKNNSEIKKYNISPRKPINQIDLITTKKLNGDIGEFIFSSPIKINNDNHQLDNKNINIIESNNNFKFSPPVAVDSLDGTNNNINSNNLIIEQNKSTTIKKNNSESANLLKTITNTTIPQLKSGSVLDALKKSSTITSKNNSNTNISTTTSSTNSGFGDKFNMSSNKWECSDCMVYNDETTNKCVACGTSKIVTTEKSVDVVQSSIVTYLNQFNTTNTFGNVFKPSLDTWECDTCMVCNKNDVIECIACSTKKPGSTKSVPSPITTASTTMNPIDIGFKNIVAEQTVSKWECSACMTPNDSNRNKCICCEQSKPGANNDVSTKFSFGAAAASVPASSQFKFGFGGDSGVPKEDDLKNNTTTVVTSTTKKTDVTDGFVFSGQNSAKDLTPSTKPLTGITFGFKTTNESTVVPTNTVPVSTVASTPGGFKFGVQTTTSTAIENKSLQTKSTTLLVTENKNSDNLKITAVTTSATTINLFNNTGFNIGGVQSTSGLKLIENSPSSQKITFGNKSDSNTTTTGSAFKSVGGFTFGSSNTKTPVTLSETKSQLFGGAVTSTAVAPVEPLKGFIFGGPPATTIATAAITTTKTPDQPIAARQEALKLFSNVIPPVYNESETGAKKAVPTIQKSTFPSSNFSFGGDSTKNVPGAANINASAITTASSIGFGSGNSASNFVFGIPPAPAPTSTSTSLFGGPITTPVGQPTSNTIAPPPTFGSIKPTVPIVSNQQPKPSLFGSPNMNSNNLGSTPTFGSNNNQTTIVSPTQQSSIFGSNFSASNLKNSTSIGTPPAGSTAAATTTVTNQQSANNLFSFGGASAKNETTTTTSVLPPTFFSNTSTTTNALTPNSSFVFGASKPIESTATQPQSNSIFGTGMTATNNNTAFGSTTFGSGSSNNNTNSAFGQSQPNINPFGAANSSTNTQQLQNTSGFGTPVPTFGSVSNTTFGSPPAQQQQQQPSFGSSSNNTSLSFGGFGSNNNNKRITGDSGDCSAAKKPAESGFNFGTVAPQSSNTGFSFGSNNNNTKPAFNFSAPVQTPTPSFNFTGAVEANTTQPFQFGAPPSNTANIQMPLFNNYVGNETDTNTWNSINTTRTKKNSYSDTSYESTVGNTNTTTNTSTTNLTRRYHHHHNYNEKTNQLFSWFKHRRRLNNETKTDDAFICSQTQICSRGSISSRTDEMTKNKTTTTTIRTNLYNKKIESNQDLMDNNDKQQVDGENITGIIFNNKLKTLEKGQQYEAYNNDKLMNDKNTNRNIFQMEQNQQKQIVLAKSLSNFATQQQEGENKLTNKIIINNNVISRSSFLFTNLYNKKIQQLNNNINSLNQYKNNNNNNEICNTTKTSVKTISSNLSNNNYINNNINKKIIYNTTQRKMFSNLKKKYHNNKKLLSSSSNTFNKLSILHIHSPNPYKFIRNRNLINDIEINNNNINKKDEISNNNNKVVTSPSLSVSQHIQNQEEDGKFNIVKNIKNNDIKLKKFKNNINLYDRNKLILNKNSNRTEIVNNTILKSKYLYIKPKE